MPTQKVTLIVVHNKIDLICHYLPNQTKLVITGKYPTLVKVWANSTLQIDDLKTDLDEADVVDVVVCIS